MQVLIDLVFNSFGVGQIVKLNSKFGRNHETSRSYSLIQKLSKVTSTCLVLLPEVKILIITKTGLKIQLTGLLFVFLALM